MDKYLNIVALNIPWPANYGGVIDIYFKLEALQRCGVKIILHCFEYERPQTAVLERVCTEVHYYHRHTGLTANLSPLPYNVRGRRDGRLLRRLLDNSHPILFEGLHTCYWINDRRLRNRFKIIRECNIEHDYYHAIGRAERNILKKIFYHLEALRFERYQKNATHADLILAVSTADRDYLQHAFPGKRVEFMPCFHGHAHITATAGQSDYMLYHGKLSVKENETAALYLIKHIFSQMPYRCIIAGMNPSPALIKAAKPYPHITVEANPSPERINTLIREAQIHVLVTFQHTGLKLKLLNSLFAGRHTVVNTAMLAGTGLDPLCFTADTPPEMISLCRELMRKPFTADSLLSREKLLFPAFSDDFQARRLVDMIFNT
ncbi:MAG: glycosyltransferase family 1 protein [Tannerella sp.]|jgi:hypothetical protein|nr:glycosyltransferase family 1 protein [Tannerella sp.]